MSAFYGRPKNEPPTASQRELVELGLEDEWLEAVNYVEVGPEGERVDKREYVTDWEKAIRGAVERDPIIRKIQSGDTLSEAEEQGSMV